MLLLQETVCKLDYEAFVRKMDLVRGWDAQKASSKWEELRDDKTVERDNQGPSTMPLRLFVPSWLLADDKVEIRKGKCEEKQVVRSTAPKKNMPEDAVEQMCLELGRGHTRDLLGGSSLSSFTGTFAQPLPLGALTAEGSARSAAEDLVLSACPSVDVTPTKRDQPDSSQKAEGTEEPTKKRAKQSTDVISLRNTSLSDMTRESSKLNRGMLQVLAEALAEHDNADDSKDVDFLSTLKDRSRVLAFWLGKLVEWRCAAERGGELKSFSLDKFDAVHEAKKVILENVSDAAELQRGKEMCEQAGEESAEAHKVRLHDAGLQHLVGALVLSPIQEASVLPSSSRLQSWFEELRKATDADTIEACISKIQEGSALALQLKDSVRQSIKDTLPGGVGMSRERSGRRTKKKSKTRRGRLRKRAVHTRARCETRSGI